MSQIEGMVTGLEAEEGSRRVIYHFSLGRSEDVTRIHIKKQSYPCYLFISRPKYCRAWFLGSMLTWPPPTLIFFSWFL